MMAFPPKAEFRKWLRSLPPDEVVAKDWGCGDCPLARWLQSAGFDSPYIEPKNLDGLGTWRPDPEMPKQAMPEWAIEFGKVIDRRCEKKSVGDTAFAPATAADCLAVLRRVPR